jgi:hypothetical protein
MRVRGRVGEEWRGSKPCGACACVVMGGHAWAGVCCTLQGLYRLAPLLVESARSHSLGPPYVRLFIAGCALVPDACRLCSRAQLIWPSRGLHDGRAENGWGDDGGWVSAAKASPARGGEAGLPPKVGGAPARRSVVSHIMRPAMYMCIRRCVSNFVRALMPT